MTSPEGLQARARAEIKAWIAENGLWHDVDDDAEAALANRLVALAGGERKPAEDALDKAIQIVKEAHRAWDSDNDPRVGKLLIALAYGRPGYRADIDEIWRHIRARSTSAPAAPKEPEKYHPTAVAVTLTGLIREHLKNCLRTIRGVDCPDLLHIVDEWAQKIAAPVPSSPEPGVLSVRIVGGGGQEAQSEETADFTPMVLDDVAVEPPQQETTPRWVCETCGERFDAETFSHSRAEHAAGCNGSCVNCPVEVECGPVSRVPGPTQARVEPERGEP